MSSTVRRRPSLSRFWSAASACAAVAAMLAFVGAPASASGGGWAWIGQSSTGGPPPTTVAAAVYDAAEGEVVVFGGDQQTTVGAYTYQSVTSATYAWKESAAGGSWTELPSANGPSPRAGAAMAYDAHTGEIVLFGGTAADGSALGDTWTWDGTHGWQKGPTTGPSPRTGAAMAYDAHAGDIVMFGGESGGTALQDTWTWDGTSWAKAATTGPSARSNAAMAFDAHTGDVVLFGGQAGSAVFGDTWTWDGSTWQQQTLSPAPTGRAGASLVYDAATQDVVLFGGQSSTSAASALSETWQWDGTSTGWTKLSPASAPPARFGAASAYYGAGGYAQDFVFGGTGTDGNALGDVWVGQIVPPQLSITTTSLPDAQVGVAYSFPLGASDGTTPYTWSAPGGLPGWLSLSGGTLSGTPTASDVGTASVTVEVTDSTTPTAQSVQETFQLKVDPATLQATSSSLPAATQGSPYTQQLQAAGGTLPYGWAIDTGSLPAGLALSQNGIISGTPLVGGSQTITFTVTDSTYPTAQESTTVPITLTVGPPVLTIVTNAMPGALVGQAFDVTLQAVGGDPSGAVYTWSLAGGSHLPGWLTLSAQGELSGTPGSGDVGSSTFTVQASDGNGHTADATFTVTVSAPGTIVDNYNLLFTTSNQSQWSPGSQSTMSLSLPIIPNYNFNKSGSAGDIAKVGGGCFIGICIPTTYFGGSISAGINGEFGLSLDLSAQGGSVSVSYPGNVQLTLTHPANSQVFTVATSWSPSPSGGSLSTTPPDATLAMDGEFGLGAYINGQLCVFSCSSFDIIPSFQIGPYNGRLFSINSSQVANTEIPIITLICSPLLYGNKCPGLSGGVYYPAITINSSAIASDGVSLQGSGSEPFFTIHANLATIIAKALTDGASPPLSAGVSFAGVDLSYTLLNIGPTATFYLDQAVQFNPGTPTVTLSFPNSVNYSIHGGSNGTQQTSLSMAAGSTVDITAPWSGTTVTPQFAIPGNQFWNDTYVDSSTSWIFQAMGLTATVGGKGVNLGPLVDLSATTPTCSASTLNTADLIAGVTQGPLPCGIQALASKGLTGTVHSFALGGFNSPTEPPVTVKLDTTPPVTTSDVTGSITAIGSAQQPTKWYDGAVTVSLTATDAGSGVASTTYTITGNNGTPSPGSSTHSATVDYNGGPHTFNTSVTVSNPGEYTMSYYSVDAAGNQETPSHVISFNYIPAPTITVVAPVNAASTVDTPVVITGTNFALPSPNGGSVVTAVSFGSYSAKTFTVVSATQVDATWQGLPNDVASPTAENIVVQTLSAASNAADFTALPRPTVTGVVPINGPESGGTTVLISGTGFTTVDGVFFGAQAADSFKVLSDTQIRAVTQPQAAGAPVDVTVHAACSTAATADATACLDSLTSSADLFQFLPRPTVTGIQPARLLTTGQTPVVITGTGFTTTEAVYFGTTQALSFHIDSDTQITAYAPPGTGSGVDVTVTTACADMYGQLWPQATSCLTSRTSQYDQVTYVTFLALAPTGPATMELEGGSALASPYGFVVDDSAAAGALTLTGHSALSAQGIEIVGTVSTTTQSTVTPTPAQGTSPMADPLASVLTPPSTAGMQQYGGASGFDVTGGTVTLKPGFYPGGISVSGAATVTLESGLYVVGGGFSVSGGAQVSGTGVTMVIEPEGTSACSGFEASGQSVVTMDPPASGSDSAYPNLALWVNCPVYNAQAVTVTGQSVVTMHGAMYAPDGVIGVGPNEAKLNVGSAVAATFLLTGFSELNGVQ